MRIFKVDAFADQPFSGNPAGVCLLSKEMPEDWMQGVAAEMNLPETAFLVERPDGAGYDLRWFTPTDEVDLCGHATLASAHVLWEEGELAAEKSARFHTKSGLLEARQEDGWVTMDFPAEPAAETDAPPALVEALGIKAVYTGRNRMDYLVVLKNEQAVRSLKPDMALLASVETRGVIVTARAAGEGDYDFVSRFFGPRCGIPEDPVTGSAHCCLGPYWRRQLGRTSLVGYQASPRGGMVRVQVGTERVLLSGQAVTILRGTLAISGGPARR